MSLFPELDARQPSAQGQSGYTLFKEQRFTPIFTQSLRISKAQVVRKWPYYHVDLNAGEGYNTDVGVPGSPVNFLAAVEREQRTNFFAFFIDKRPEAIAKLTPLLAAYSFSNRIAIHTGDNAELLPVVREFVVTRERPQYAMGSIVIDPNGYHSGVPWEELAVFCAEFPRFDLIFNLNILSFRRERGHIIRGNKGWTNKPLRLISSFPRLLSRANWMITEETRLTGTSWVQLVGRTMATNQPSYSSLGYYSLQSERGQAIVNGIERQALNEGDDAPKPKALGPLLREL